MKVASIFALVPKPLKPSYILRVTVRFLLNTSKKWHFKLNQAYKKITATIFLKFSGFYDSGMERYVSPKLAAEIQF